MKMSVEKLRALHDPFNMDLWAVAPITKHEIAKAIRENRLQTEVYKEDLWDKKQSTKKYHIERIAYFVVSGWTDPIGIDVGIPCAGYHIEPFVCSGNHRFAAAIYRGDKFIDIEYSGQVGYAEEVLGLENVA